MKIIETIAYHMNFSQEQIAVIQSKHGKQNQFVFAIMLKFFEINGSFPKQNDPDLQKIMTAVNKMLQLEINGESSWVNRSAERFKQEIRSFFGFRLAAWSDKGAFFDYCQTYIFPYAPKSEQALEQAHSYFKEQKLEPYSKQQIERFLKEAHHHFEQRLFKDLTNSLSETLKKQLDQLVFCTDEVSLDSEGVGVKPKTGQPSSNQSEACKPINFIDLKDCQVHLKMSSIVWFVQKHNFLKDLKLPTDLEHKGCFRKLLMRYYERILTEKPSSIARYKPEKRYAYLAIFCYIRQQLSSDTLADLLLEMLKRLTRKATNQIDKNIKSDAKRVSGKMGLLLLLAKKSMDHPNGVIENTIYPVVSKEVLGEIVEDLGTDKGWYQLLVKTRLVSLYKHTNRQTVWLLMEALDFDTDLKLKPHLKALRLLKKLKKIETTPKGILIKKRLYSANLLKYLIPKEWLPLVSQNYPNTTQKVALNWHGLELALLSILQTELETKNIWVRDSFRYRDPQKDLPLDFEENKDFYFNLLKLPKDADVFIKSLKERLESSLQEFNETILSNAKVKIKKRPKKGAIRLTPFDPQLEPLNLELLKTTIAKNWPQVQLIDVLKEGAHRVGFLDKFQAVTSRESIPKEKLHKRLLLCLFGIGTNTGLKRMSSLSGVGERYDDLLYVKKRYISTESVRSAIQDVTDALLTIRDPKIWKHGTTIGASDSTKISVWDQNLMAQWHKRYGGRGVMIYWHVKEGLCIHSSLKTCTSSEVGAMIQGVLHHDTLMDFDKISVDTHGQSSIGFAFSELFGFELLPRLKDLHKQKLYCSSKSQKEKYPNLTDALSSEGVAWRKIEENYQEIIKHALALKLKIVGPEVMLRRLSSNIAENPVYQALLELGKATRTLFLCRYLAFEELRIEIGEALNVVERVNGLMNFIFYGRLGEISTNKKEDQELSILCLHLLQACMAYVTTILIQTTLSDPKWEKILTTEDKRALSPLFQGHINPYGLLSLDMDERLIIEKHQFKGEVYA